MNHKLENDVFLLVNSLNKSQKLLLSRKWSKEPYTNYLYVQVYLNLLKSKKYDSTLLLASTPNLKPHQLANVQKELHTKILEHLRGKKQIIYKMRSKKKTRRKQGHRQELTRVLIENISIK
jgi:ribosomal protein L21